MSIKVGINGLGRIGRCIVRALNELPYEDIELVAVNASASTDDLVHFLKYDSVHGRAAFDIRAKDGDTLIISGKEVKIFRERDPALIGWGRAGVDIVFECTGAFKDIDNNQRHINAGAKKVIISAPAKEGIKTVVYGVNDSELTEDDKIISIGSCTTNCLAPVAKIINDHFGIKEGFVTTIHSYTNDQNIIDAKHKDLRRARAAALSMIPTSTGAAKAIGLVIPSLAGKLDGTAIRVPTPNVSMIDFCANVEKDVSVAEINDLMREYANGKMKGILAIEEDKLVSCDFNHNPHSSIFDMNDSKVINSRFIRVVSWYDNEWGFSVRMLDVARKIGN